MGVGIDGVGDLVVAALIERAEVEPNFRDVSVDQDGPQVRVEGITVLVDLEVQDSDRAPERWVPPITVDSLLLCFVGFAIL